jgi:hypothetical protein
LVNKPDNASKINDNLNLQIEETKTHRVGSSIGHTSNTLIQEAILKAAETTNEDSALLKKMANKSNL